MKIDAAPREYVHAGILEIPPVGRLTGMPTCRSEAAPAPVARTVAGGAARPEEDE